MAKVTVIRDNCLIDKMEVVTNSDGGLTVYAPPDYPIREIKGCLERNIASIKRRFSVHSESEIPEKNLVADRRTSDYFTYKLCLIFGNPVEILPCGEKQKTSLIDGKLYIAESLCHEKDCRRKTVQTFLKKTAKEILGEKVSGTGSKIRMCPIEINFKPQRGNSWLNCHDACKKIITIDYRAIQLPENLQDYLILHSYTHFYEGSHSERFYKALSNFIPDYEKCQSQLENYLFLKDL